MWEDKEFLVCVKTYPEYSQKYTETVCTAGILRDNGKLIRIYPLPYRYLGGEKQFRKYQWVRAQLKKNFKDNRPESHLIRLDSIAPGQRLESEKQWSLRNQWVLTNPDNIFQSLEALQQKERKDGTSLGLIRPKSVLGFHIEAKNLTDLSDENARKRNVLSQRSFHIEKKNLDLIPYRFVLEFICDDQNCRGHKISILDWEFGELYRKVSVDLDWRSKIEKKVSQICSPGNNLHFFMGNMAARRQTFCILGFYYPPNSAIQRSMFHPLSRS